MNTYQQMLDLVAAGHAKVSINGKFSTFRYAKQVMFGYKWNDIPGIMECRGHTYDNTTGELVVAAPSKTFNYLENSNWADVPLSTQVVMFKKYNGFLACLSEYEGQKIVSTTGSTKSDFVKVAEKHLADEETVTGITQFFEIIDENDPHIVDEGKPGAVFLGSRSLVNGHVLPYGNPIYCMLEEAIEIAKSDRGEGFMVYIKESPGDTPCKLKTPYYVGKKKLMRASAGAVNTMYNHTKDYAKSLPDMWKHLPELITSTINKEAWTTMQDQERRIIIERYEL